ncbi:MAG: hypothetical protein EZS28_009137 [Streblomastix strix]|uniref:Uncharacterized protein n=1 Tax=Streblomastix strix TaxID=222440 RepID=A0A5J4WL34_9EUKA|nr:MAG: hypothetical protein EZS28_009137 [Streblomastix strix]
MKGEADKSPRNNISRKSTIKSSRSIDSGGSSDELKKDELIRLLKAENETLKRKKDEIEKYSRDYIVILETQLREEKELREKEHKQLPQLEMEVLEEKNKKAEFANQVKILTDQLQSMKDKTDKTPKKKDLFGKD